MGKGNAKQIRSFLIIFSMWIWRKYMNFFPDMDLEEGRKQARTPFGRSLLRQFIFETLFEKFWQV